MQQQGHQVVSIYHEARGLDDDSILQKAVSEGRILITNDKDFGEMIFREKKSHKGVILLRLDDERPQNKIRVIEESLNQHGQRLPSNFIVATESSVRINTISNI